jgi:hypothetical protein
MKKTIFRLFFLFAILSTLWCCRNEEFSAGDPAQESFYRSSTRFASKSFWKEDEVYIHKVQQVFMKVANAEHVKSRYGELYWDYAMTFGQFGEKYLLVPVVKNNRVALLMEAVREGNKVYFFEKDDKRMADFFHAVIFSNITDSGEKTEPQTGVSSRNTSTFVCSTRWITIGCTNNEPNCTPYTTSETVCKWTPGTTPKTFDPIGMDDGGGGGGYEYPDPPETEDPCSKLKAQTSNLIFKNNITSLEGKTSDNYESGYRIGTNSNGTLQNQILQNKPGTQQVDLKAFSNTITLMHSHYDGLYPMFSPGDIIFFNQWIVWAQNWNAIPTNTPKIPLNNLTFTLVTSNGNYSFNFDGTSTTPLPNYTIQELDKLNKDYIENLNKAVTIGNVSGDATYNMEKLETEFLKFMSDKMNMDGLKLYKTTTSGNSSLTLVNGTRQEADCPN